MVQANSLFHTKPALRQTVQNLSPEEEIYIRSGAPEYNQIMHGGDFNNMQAKSSWSHSRRATGLKHKPLRHAILVPNDLPPPPRSGTAAAVGLAPAHTRGALLPQVVELRCRGISTRCRCKAAQEGSRGRGGIAPHLLPVACMHEAAACMRRQEDRTDCQSAQSGSSHLLIHGRLDRSNADEIRRCYPGPRFDEVDLISANDQITVNLGKLAALLVN